MTRQEAARLGGLATFRSRFPGYVCNQLSAELGRSACSVCFRYVGKCLLSRVGGRREEALKVWSKYQAEKKEVIEEKHT